MDCEVFLLLSTWQWRSVILDLKIMKNLPQSQTKDKAETLYCGNKVSGWMQLVDSVPGTLGVYFS